MYICNYLKFTNQPYPWLQIPVQTWAATRTKLFSGRPATHLHRNQPGYHRGEKNGGWQMLEIIKYLLSVFWDYARWTRLEGRETVTCNNHYGDSCENATVRQRALVLRRGRRRYNAGRNDSVIRELGSWGNQALTRLRPLRRYTTAHHCSTDVSYSTWTVDLDRIVSFVSYIVCFRILNGSWIFRERLNISDCRQNLR